MVRSMRRVPMRHRFAALRLIPYAVALALALAAPPASAADSTGGELPSYLKDRGPGVYTSMFGVYVESGELLLYPFFEYYKDRNAEYSPQELGYGLDQDFRGGV